MMKHAKLYIIITVSAALLFILQMVGCGGSESTGTATMRVKKETFEVIIPGFGELQAVKSTPIMVPPQVRGRQTIAWMLPENSFVEKGSTVAKLDANWYHERIQKENFGIQKIDLDIKDKERELQREKSELNGQLNLTSIERDMADVYAARDENIYSRNQIIKDSINLDYLKQKTSFFC